MILKKHIETKPRVSEAPTESPPSKHLHIYQRSKNNKNIYKCVDPDCTHYTNKEFIENKRARCFKCKDEFVIPPSQLKNKNVVCDFCSKSTKSVKLNTIKSKLEDILSGIAKPNWRTKARMWFMYLQYATKRYADLYSISSPAICNYGGVCSEISSRE